jgi:hypothetical protein
MVKEEHTKKRRHIYAYIEKCMKIKGFLEGKMQHNQLTSNRHRKGFNQVPSKCSPEPFAFLKTIL